MKSFIVVAALVALASAGTAPIKRVPASGRIIDGAPAELGQFPWQVAVNGNGLFGGWFCGGSLISDQWVLTAAHCVADARSFEIRIGSLQSSSGGTVQSTSTYIQHEDYDDFNLQNDIALIKLSSPVQISASVSPVGLPSASDYVPAGTSVRVSGWGLESDSSSSVARNLNWVDLTTIENPTCDAIYGIVGESIVCTTGEGTKSTCSGDSGGPLTVLNGDGSRTQVGVVSFGASAGCEKGFPNGFSRTSSFRDWIKTNSGV